VKFLYVPAVVLLTSLAADAAVSDAELISRALAFAREAKSGIHDKAFAHCRQRALSYSSTPRVGRNDNINDVTLSRTPPYTVAFMHYGTAYDGCNCKVTVRLDRHGKAQGESTERLECAGAVAR
jgi:hypothetical protein